MGPPLFIAKALTTRARMQTPADPGCALPALIFPQIVRSWPERLQPLAGFRMAEIAR